MKIIIASMIILLSYAEISIADPRILRKDALGDSNIYAVAIKAFCDSVAQRMDADDQQIFFLEDNHALLEFDTIVDGKLTIIKATTEALINEYDRLKGSFAMLVIFPAEVQGNALTIGFNRYYFTYKAPLIGRNKMEYGLQGGYTMHFRFNCDAQQFQITRVKAWGV